MGEGGRGVSEGAGRQGRLVAVALGLVLVLGLGAWLLLRPSPVRRLVHIWVELDQVPAEERLNHPLERARGTWAREAEQLGPEHIPEMMAVLAEGPPVRCDYVHGQLLHLLTEHARRDRELLRPYLPRLIPEFLDPEAPLGGRGYALLGLFAADTPEVQDAVERALATPGLFADGNMLPRHHMACVTKMPRERQLGIWRAQKDPAQRAALAKLLREANPGADWSELGE